MLVIRLRRIGRKHDPHYRLVVAEHTAPVQGKFQAEVGHYHPKSKELVVNQDQFLGWIEQGATPSNTVAKLADRAGITHERIAVKQYKSQPKKKAQERAGAQAESQAKPELKQATSEETSEAEIKEETTEETPSEEVAEESPSEDTAEETNEEESTADKTE